MHAAVRTSPFGATENHLICWHRSADFLPTRLTMAAELIRTPQKLLPMTTAFMKSGGKSATKPHRQFSYIPLALKNTATVAIVSQKKPSVPKPEGTVAHTRRF